MSNIKVSSDIDELLRKSTKEEAATFLGIQKDSPTFNGPATFSGGTTATTANIQLIDPQTTANQLLSKCKMLLETANGDQGTFELKDGRVNIGAGNSGGGGIGTFLSSSVNAGPDYSVSLNAGDGTLFLAGDVGVRVTDDLHVVTSGAGIDTSKVGIRTTTPSEALDVDGTIKGTGLDVSGNIIQSGNFDQSGNFSTSGSIVAGGNTELQGNVTIPTANKALTKQNCYNINGGVKLQKNASDSDVVALYYEGVDSNDFVIRQYHDGSSTKDGQIKLIGALPSDHDNAGDNAIRLDAQNIDIGTGGNTGTKLTKIFSDTNFASQKKFVFVDSRNEDHGLQFKHSNSNAPTFQFGMAGAAWNSNDFGQFKVRHTTSLGVTEDVIVVDRYNGYTKLESDRTDIKNAKIAGYAQVGDLPSETTATAGMMIFDGTNFKGFNGSQWVTLG